MKWLEGAGCLAAILLVLMAPIISALFGAFSGWVVGWFFSGIVLRFFDQIGIRGLNMTQLGLALGFIGGFFRSSYNSSKTS